MRLRRDLPLSSFNFNFNLRRYIPADKQGYSNNRDVAYFAVGRGRSCSKTSVNISITLFLEFNGGPLTKRAISARPYFVERVVGEAGGLIIISAP